MAGLFSGYNNPGPGVPKNEPEKRPFFRFCELYFRKFWKLMLANLLYVLVSLPVVTRGMAEAGLTYVTRNYSREKPVFLPSDFWDTIKKNRKQSFWFGLAELLVGAVVAYSLYYYVMACTVKVSFGTVIPLAIALFATLMFVFMRYYLYLQLITFKFSGKQIVRNSALFAAAGVKQNAVITGVLLAIYVLVYLGLAYLPWFTLGIVIVGYVTVFPAFRSFLIQYTVFPLVKKAIIDPYYKEHPDEDVEKRRDLNLEIDSTVAEKTEPKEEPIFTDTPAMGPGEVSVVPHQYNEAEMRRGKPLKRETMDADDDGTI